MGFDENLQVCKDQMELVVSKHCFCRVWPRTSTRPGGDCSDLGNAAAAASVIADFAKSERDQGTRGV